MNENKFLCHRMNCPEYQTDDSNFCPKHFAECHSTTDPLVPEALKGATFVGPKLVSYDGAVMEVREEVVGGLVLERYDYDVRVVAPIGSPKLMEVSEHERESYFWGKEKYQESFRPGMESEEDEFFDPGSFEGQLGQVLAELGELLRKKNKDYGSSYDKTVEELGETVILVRIMDKFNRMKQLIKSGDDPEVEETIEETLLDLVGYGLIELVRRRRQ